MQEFEEDLLRRCDQIADRLITRYHWQLLDRHAFARRIHGVAIIHPSSSLSYLAFGVYNQALHTACSGAEGPLRWEQAYNELFQMLSERARYRYPDVWEDAVQSAIELVCVRYTNCVVPQAFFQFAWGHLQNAVRTARRTQSRNELSFEQTAGDGATLKDIVPDTHPNISDEYVNDELRATLRAALVEFERLHSRARNQLAAVRLKFLDGLEDEVIGNILGGLSAKRVHELRSLGIKKLRSDPRLRRLFGPED